MPNSKSHVPHACGRIGDPWVRATLTVVAFALCTIPAAHAQADARPAGDYGFKVVHAFKGPSDGAYPWAGLVRAKDGNLYGTTWAGGSYPDCKGGLGAGCGALYRLDASGKVKVIYSFVGVRGPIHLYGELLSAPDGAFYGLTNEGGTASFCYQGGANGCGTMFELDESGRLKVLYNFGTNGGASDALFPAGSLVGDSRGNFYGTSSMGGINNNGTIFEVSRRGKEKVLYRFTGGTDGGGPSPTLVRDSAGNLYGTAAHGGGSCNCGTVFKLDPGGALAVLYTFQGGTDGGNPVAGLIEDAAGNFYGTAGLYGESGCGGGGGCGVVFRLDPNGVETVLHTFTDSPDGAIPVSPLVRDRKGNLFGVTWLGGDSNCNDGPGCGVVYEVSAGGRERVLHAFAGTDGLYSWGQLHRDKAGNLFGTTQQGGRLGLCPNGCGVVYELSPSGG